MERILTFWVIGLLMTITGSISVAEAGLQSVIGGSNAPASTLGPYNMVGFADDLRTSIVKYSYVESPLEGNVTFDLPLELHEVLENWGTWGHDYDGNVYWTGEDELLVTLTMPAGTSAFYFYAQPQNVAVNTITAVAYDGCCIEGISHQFDINSDAYYYGFYGTEGSTINKISIYSDTSDFAIGEFGISMIPSPEAFLLGSIGLCAVMELKKRQLI